MVSPVSDVLGKRHGATVRGDAPHGGEVLLPGAEGHELGPERERWSYYMIVVFCLFCLIFDMFCLFLFDFLLFLFIFCLILVVFGWLVG